MFSPLKTLGLIAHFPYCSFTVNLSSFYPTANGTPNKKSHVAVETNLIYLYDQKK